MRPLNRYSPLMAAAILVTGFWVDAACGQNWVAQAPAGQGYFARAEAIFLKRDESDAATLATLNTPGTPGRPALLVTEDVGFDHETGFRVIAGMMLDQCTQVEVEYFGIDEFEGDAATLTRPAGRFALNSVYTVLNQTPLAYRASGESELYNGEINIRKTRQGCNWSNSVLVGFRYLHIRDELQLDTFGPPPFTVDPLALTVPPANSFETTATKTKNNIFGLQLGGDLGYTWNYITLSAAFEGFLYANFYESEARNQIIDPSGFFLTAAGGGTSRLSTDEDEKATIGVGAQIGLDAAVNLTENIILRGGYQFLVLSDVALGSEQLPEVRPSPTRGARISNPDRSKELGSLLFHGPAAGIEIRW